MTLASPRSRPRIARSRRTTQPAGAGKRRTPAGSPPRPAPEIRYPRWESPQRLIDGDLPPTFGPLVADFIEANLVHGEGDSLGQPIRLEPFQRYILNRKYEYDPETGRLLYDRVLIGVGKGNAKTELMAADADAELFGPIAPISPHVVVSAASWDNANNLFGAAGMMIDEGPLKPVFAKSLHDDRIENPERVGVLKRIAAVAGSNDGGLPSAVYGDELHEWEGERRERVWVVQGNSLKKRTPRSANAALAVQRAGSQQTGITTAGDDPNGLLRRLYDHGRTVAAGEVADPGFLFLWWEADETLDLDDPDQLVEAILQANPAAGSFLSVENLVQRFHDPTVARYEFERYHLNRWVSPPSAWISLDVWMGRKRVDGEGRTWSDPPPPDSRVWLGFDGSKSRDSTALVGCTAEGYLFVIGMWERDMHNPDWVVPRGEVDAVVARAFRTWDIELMQVDPPRWERELEDWVEEYGAERVLAFDTAVYERMAPAVGRLEDAIRDGSMTHDADPRLARHVANARTKETRWGLVITKEHKDSPRRIDAAVAAVLAHDGVTAPIEPEPDRTAEGWRSDRR